MRIASLILVLGLAPALIVAPANAQSSCGGFQAVCAQRCKERAPTDTSCVADHCSPKLLECRSSGCWQEGKMYGGKLTCGLRKG
ncbi:MAG: hypothetical protein HZY79_14205 [Rhodoblastus sp.]|nr:MAG: hypothetical protein HZY79_14205 [Rhodoblastus sp.]